jgi:hypothetical protein
MFPINDVLDAILLGSFFFGLIFVAVTLLIGAVGDAGGHDAGGHDAGGHGGGGHHGLDLLGFLNVSTMLAFIGWFGGAGYLVRNGLGWVAPIALIIGLIAGLAGATAVTWFLRRVIAPADRAMDPHDYELPGTLARVSSSIRADGTGEIVYEQQGYRQVSAARGMNGSAVGRGVEVVILEMRAGIAYVQPWTDLIEESDERAVRASLDEQFQALDAVAADIPRAESPELGTEGAPVPVRGGRTGKAL